MERPRAPYVPPARPESPWQTPPVIPPPLTGISPLVVKDGPYFKHADGRPFIWAGCTSFDLPVRVREGDLRWADWLAETGFTLARIVPASLYRTPRSLADGVRDLPKALKVLRDRNLYAEVVVGVDTKAYGLTREDYLAYCRDIGAICREAKNAVAEGANEITHGTQAGFLADADVQRLAKAALGVTFAAGSSHGGEGPMWVRGDFITHHTDRSRTHEDNAARMALVQRRLLLPIVDDESIGTAEAAIPGKRTADPEFGARQARACRAYGLGGVTLHLEAGLEARVDQLGPVQRESASRFIAAMKE